MLGLHTETIRRMARGGKLPAFRIAGRLKFTPNDVERLAFAEPIVPLEREESRARARLSPPSPSGRVASRVWIISSARRRRADG